MDSDFDQQCHHNTAPDTNQTTCDQTIGSAASGVGPVTASEGMQGLMLFQNPWKTEFPNVFTQDRMYSNLTREVILVSFH